MIQNWAPESFTWIPRGSHSHGSVESWHTEMHLFSQLALRSSAARSGQVSCTQTKPYIVTALCPGMFWKIRNLQTVVLTTGSITAPHLEEHPCRALLVSINVQHRHNLTELQVRRSRLFILLKGWENHTPSSGWVQVGEAPIIHSPFDCS